MNSKVIYKFDTERQLLVCQYAHLGKSILTVKSLKYNENDATAIDKHCHQHNHQFYSSYLI